MGILTQAWGEPYRFELWDTSTQELFKSISFSADVPLTGLAFSPDALLAAVAQANGRFSLWISLVLKWSLCWMDIQEVWNIWIFPGMGFTSLRGA